MRDPFWKSAKILLNYKRPLALALAGAMISGACFGAGLGGIMLAVTHLLGKQKSVGDLIREQLAGSDRSAIMQDFGNWLAGLLTDNPLRDFLSVIAVIVAVTLIGNIGRFMHEFLVITVVQHAAMVWRSRMIRRILNLPMVELMQSGTADHMSRVIFDTRPLSRSYRAIMSKSVEQVLKGGIAVTIALVIDWKLTLLALVCVPPLGIMLRKFGKRIRRASRRALQQRGRMVAVLKDSMSAIRVVKVHDAEGLERRRFARVNRGVYREEMKIRTVRALASPMIDCLGMLGIAAVVSVAAYLVFQIGYKSERFIWVIGMLAGAAASLKPLANLNNQINEGRAAAERLFNLLDLPVEPSGVRIKRGLPDLPHHRRSIEFEQVTFAYPGGRGPAVRDVSVHIDFGQTTAIVGANGSGKTTLLSLLPRLFDPQHGRILIDGADLCEVTLRSLRRQIAVVTQQSALFEASIADNVAYGRRHVPRDRIIAATRAAYCDEFITALPDGYDTLLGEHGEGLSGGQRQRLCIARAILRDPAILILDEATSQIDAESEAKINKVLRNVRQGRTVFVIAHRLSTVLDADRIIVMGDGRIIDQGTHDHLLQKCELYRTLTHTQLQPPAA